MDNRTEETGNKRRSSRILNQIKLSSLAPKIQQQKTLTISTTSKNRRKELTAAVQQHRPVIIPAPTLYIPSELISKMDPSTLFQRISSLNSFAKSLQQQIASKQSVKRLIFAFLSNRKNQLWSIKYEPKNLEGVSSAFTLDQINQWLEKFSENVVNRQDLPDNQIDSSNSFQSRKNSSSKNFLQKVFILYGREGVGKLTLLKCLAETMGMEPHVCSNEQDRFKYIKDKEESIKSQCVINKKASPGSNALLTSYFQKNKKQMEKFKFRSLQIIHEIGQVYPNEKNPDTNKFHADLIKFIGRSMVPFAFTSSSLQSIPIVYNSVDRVEFKEPTKRELAQFFWKIYHIEYCLSKCWSNDGIEKEHILTTLDKQLEHLKYKEIIEIKHFEDIVEIFEFKLDRIFNLFQYHFIQKTTNLQLIKKDAISRMVEYASNTLAETMAENFPIQQMISNPIETYYQSNKQPQSIQERLSDLNRLMNQDLLQNTRTHSTVSTFSHESWIDQVDLGLNQGSISEHYPISNHICLKKKASKLINRSIPAVYSSFSQKDLPLLKTEKRTRAQSREISQVLEQIMGVTLSRYILNFAKLD